MISIQTAQVYKVKGRYSSRRFFTLKAAINRAAWEMICSRDWYEREGDYTKLHARLVRFIKAGLPNNACTPTNDGLAQAESESTPAVICG